ncbi:MAG: metallophosphoesterase [Lachnospiraceae bacterium]|nr:metallophosphoesterase [Lachnospiraceae bacterium]MDD5852763.1 metallophosphoesterase [Lachnospiraceae bacterium]
MKILIVSDTHRQNENYFTVIKRVGKVDMVIHCGDAEGSEYALQKAAGCPLYIVSGNNDFFSNLSKELELEIEGKKVLVTHGHYYYVSNGIERLKEEGLSRHYDIVMFGHTHRPLIKYQDGLTMINPGSLSYPRQEGKRPSYILLEIDDKGEFVYHLEYL